VREKRREKEESGEKKEGKLRKIDGK